MPLTGDFYGKMREVPPKVKADPVTVPCSKCKGMFILEKAHKEVFVVSMFWARQKDGTLTPALPVSDGYHRLCLTCNLKLKEWFNRND